MGDAQDSNWPLTQFSFQVDFGDGIAGGFQAVSGLESQVQPIDDRAAATPIFAAVHMPEIAKPGNVTLKRGVFTGNDGLWDWFSTITMNTIQRRAVTIRLLDEAGNPAMAWTLGNAWPTKITGTDPKSDGNEVAVESLELAFETMVISVP